MIAFKNKYYFRHGPNQAKIFNVAQSRVVKLPNHWDSLSIAQGMHPPQAANLFQRVTIALNILGTQISQEAVTVKGQSIYSSATTSRTTMYQSAAK